MAEGREAKMNGTTELIWMDDGRAQLAGGRGSERGWRRKVWGMLWRQAWLAGNEVIVVAQGKHCEKPSSQTTQG